MFAEKLKKTYILVGAGNKIIKIQHQVLGRQNISEISLQTVSRIGALAYNYRDSKSIHINFIRTI